MRIRFFLAFVFAFTLAGGIHFAVLSFLEISPATAFFWECYLGNFFFTLCLLWGLLKAFDQHSHSIAWIYLLASGLKFALFFLLLWPLFKADGSLSNLERASFFIPYFIGVFLETGILIFRLNKI